MKLLSSKRKSLVIISLILVVILIASAAVGCVPKRTTSSTTTGTTDSELTQRVKDLESKVASLPSSGGDYDGEIESLYAEIEALNERIDNIMADVDDAIAAFEEEQTNDNGSSGSSGSCPTESVRWIFDTPEIVWTTGSPDPTGITVDIDQDRIDESGLYDVTVGIFNTSGGPWTMNNKIRLVMNPRDEALLNEKTTYLDTDQAPWVYWDAEFITREREGCEVTKRVEFESEDEFTYTIANNSYKEIKLVLELYYAS